MRNDISPPIRFTRQILRIPSKIKQVDHVPRYHCHMEYSRLGSIIATLHLPSIFFLLIPDTSRRRRFFVRPIVSAICNRHTEYRVFFIQQHFRILFHALLRAQCVMLTCLAFAGVYVLGTIVTYFALLQVLLQSPCRYCCVPIGLL